MDTYLTVTEAASRYNLPLDKLYTLASLGKIKLSSLSNGVEIVSDDEIQNALPREERAEYKAVAHLKGVAISVREASRKYDIPHPTISRWVRDGYIALIGYEGRKTLIDEADIAYCATVYKSNAGQGRWVFDKSGIPYKPKAKK